MSTQQYLIRNICEHDDEMNVGLKDHLPKMTDCLRQRTLTGDVEPLLVAHRGRDMTRVDVARLVVLIKIKQINVSVDNHI